MTNMTGESYLAAIQRLGIDQEQAAEFFGVTSRTLRTYSVNGAPKVFAMLLRVMIAEHISVDEVNRIMKRKDL